MRKNCLSGGPFRICIAMWPVCWAMAAGWIVAQAQEPVTVPVVRPQRATVERATTQPATVYAYYQAEIHAKVAGYLDQVQADIGDTVKAGATLAVIQVPELRKQLERQAAQVARWQAEELRADAHRKLAAASLDAAKATFAQTQAEVEKTRAQETADQLEFERIEQLVARRVVEAKLLDEITKRRDASRASRSAADSSAVSASARVVVASEQLAVAAADVDVAKAQTLVAQKELEELEVLLSHAAITAPFDGVITERHVDPGDLVRNTQNSAEAPRKPLFVMCRIDRVRVRLTVPEDAAPFVNAGDAVSLKLRAWPHRKIDGVVARTARGIDEVTRTMQVEVELPNPDGQLLPGMFGEATVTLEAIPDALMLPAGAVRYTEQGQAYVYVIGPDDTIRKVVVQPGFDDGKQTQIVAGVKGDERLVDAMIGRLADGQKVRAVEKK